MEGPPVVHAGYGAWFVRKQRLHDASFAVAESKANNLRLRFRCSDQLQAGTSNRLLICASEDIRDGVVWSEVLSHGESPKGESDDDRS